MGTDIHDHVILGELGRQSVLVAQPNRSHDLRVPRVGTQCQMQLGPQQLAGLAAEAMGNLFVWQLKNDLRLGMPLLGHVVPRDDCTVDRALPAELVAPACDGRTAFGL